MLVVKAITSIAMGSIIPLISILNTDSILMQATN